MDARVTPAHDEQGAASLGESLSQRGVAESWAGATDLGVVPAKPEPMTTEASGSRHEVAMTSELRAALSRHGRSDRTPRAAAAAASPMSGASIRR